MFTKFISSPPAPIESQLDQLLKIKNLNANAFVPGEIKLTDDISHHCAWAFKHIYSVPYRGHEVKDGIARRIHGIQHVGRVALYIPVLANLYRRYGYLDALKLTQDDIKLLQIAALFHDSARQGDDVDHWDYSSGLLLYFYLTKILGVGAEKARFIATATANKDVNKKDKMKTSSAYYYLVEDVDGQLGWTKAPVTPVKNIYQKLIHDADCLDIIRARSHFDANYLDFCKEIASYNASAFDEMAYLITEVRSIIALQGDRYGCIRPDIKKRYEHPDAFAAIMQTILRQHLHILPALYAKNQLLSGRELDVSLLNDPAYKVDQELNETNLKAAIREGKVFARSIYAPSAIRNKEQKVEENLAAVEIRKMSRRPGVPTRTNKADRLEKKGNPQRSVSLIGWGGGVFSSAGFLIVNPILNEVSSVSSVDVDTNRGKKKLNMRMDAKTARGKLVLLLVQQKMGGSSRQFASFVSTHSEILYRITKVDAIYFTQDPTLFSTASHAVIHPNSAELQAIFLQNEYQRMNGKTLPIFEYSGVHNIVRQVPPYQPEEIVKLWEGLCEDYIKNKLTLDDYQKVLNVNESLAHMKIHAMYPNLKSMYVKQNAPADSNYDEKLQEKINATLELQRVSLTNKFINSLIEEARGGKLSIRSPRGEHMLTEVPAFRNAMHSQLITELAKELNTEDLYGQISVAPFNHSREILIRTPQFLRLYLLINEDEAAKSIKASLINLAEKALSEIRKTKQYGKVRAIGWSGEVEISFVQMRHLIYFVNNCKIVTSFSEEINKYLNILHDKVSALYASRRYNCRLVSYTRLIEFIKSHQTLAALGDKPRKFVVKCAERLLNAKQKVFGDFLSYMTLSRLVGIDLLEQKNVVIEWMRTAKIKNAQRMMLCDELLENSFMQDPDVLYAYLLLFEPTSNCLPRDKAGTDMHLYFSHLLYIAEHFPGNKFSTSHLSVINHRAAQHAEQYIQEVASIKEQRMHFLFLIRTARSIKKLNFDIPKNLLTHINRLYYQLPKVMSDLDFHITCEVDYLRECGIKIGGAHDPRLFGVSGQGWSGMIEECKEPAAPNDRCVIM